jgi:hypothetical protein
MRQSRLGISRDYNCAGPITVSNLGSSDALVSAWNKATMFFQDRAVHTQNFPLPVAVGPSQWLTGVLGRWQAAIVELQPLAGQWLHACIHKADPGLSYEAPRATNHNDPYGPSLFFHGCRNGFCINLIDQKL